jgi:hypothetical protein
VVEEKSEISLENKDHKAHRISRYIFLGIIVTIGILLSVLSENLTIGPSWMYLVLTLILSIPFFITLFRGFHEQTRLLALTILGVISIGLVSSVFFLVLHLFSHTMDASNLFRNAAILWVTNVIVFGVWYWEIDQGGPIARHMNHRLSTDFLFPQMISDAPYWSLWKPQFIDYLFLAFNTSTAFSPTDTMVMSKRAKLLMMAQGSISLVIVAILAARAINIA